MRSVRSTLLNRFDRLIRQSDGFELCDGTFCLISEVFGKLEVEKEVEPCRTIRLVFDSVGVIGNGGFHFLFERDYGGDPGFIHAAAGFKTIGAHRAYAAFKKALALFPRNSPPKDIEERLEIYESYDKATTDGIEQEFYSAGEEITRCLAKFIRENAGDIRLLISGRS